MGDRTAKELADDFIKLAKGTERDVQRYEKKVAEIEQSQADFAAFVAAIKAAMADRANLTADKVAELSAAAGKLVPQLVAAHNYVTQKTKTGSNKNIMLNEPSWIIEDVTKAAGSVARIVSDLAKCPQAERDQARLDMIKAMFSEEMLTAHPDILRRDIKDIWKDYIAGVSSRVNAIKDKPKDLISHPDKLDAQQKQIDALLKQLATVYDQVQAAKQKKDPPAPRAIRLPLPRIMYPHR